MSQNIQLFPDIVNHDLYFAIAKENLQKAIEADSEIEQRTWSDNVFTRSIGLGLVENELTHKEYRGLEKKIYKHTTISVIFSALTIESFINYLALSDQYYNYSKSQYEKIFKQASTDDLNFVSKEYNLGNGIELCKTIKKLILILKKEHDNNLISKVTATKVHEIFSIRNNLVHYNAYISGKDRNDERENSIKAVRDLFQLETDSTNYEQHISSISLDKTKQIINTVEKLMQELKSINSNININWLKNNKWLV